MKVVVDTNVIVYLLLGSPDHGTDVLALWRRATEVVAPALWEAELANTLWMAVRAGVIRLEELPDKLGQATRMGIHSIPVRSLWHGAVTRSMTSNVAVYDTLFVELADREHVPLFTYDKKILQAYTEIARTAA